MQRYSFNYTQAQVAVGEEKAAKISFDKSTHDYGQIEQNANGECVFVTNTGNAPLKLPMRKVHVVVPFLSGLEKNCSWKNR